MPAEGIVMVWIVVGVAALNFLWIAAPTLRTFLGPDFEPTRRSDGIVFQAQHSSSHG